MIRIVMLNLYMAKERRAALSYIFIRMLSVHEGSALKLFSAQGLISNTITLAISFHCMNLGRHYITRQEIMYRIVILASFSLSQ